MQLQDFHTLGNPTTRSHAPTYHKVFDSHIEDTQQQNILGRREKNETETVKIKLVNALAATAKILY